MRCEYYQNIGNMYLKRVANIQNALIILINAAANFKTRCQYSKRVADIYDASWILATHFKY